MILQTLDIRNNCKGIYHAGTFLFDNFEAHLSKYSSAWKHSPILDDERYKYLFVLSRGAPLETFSDDPESFLDHRKILSAHQRALTTAKVDLTNSCFYELLPPHILTSWFSAKEEALRSLSEHSAPGPDYDILHKAHVLTTEIRNQEISFAGLQKRVEYNIFGSATGRLTTKRGSAPVLTLKKSQRTMLQPKNSAFVELDFNAAELRTLLALSGKKQPPGDLHEYLMNQTSSGLTRTAFKEKLFAWLYNPSAPDSDLAQFFSRQIFRDFFDSTGVLETPYGRRLPVSERKAQNYLLQSTTSDIVIENAYKIMKILQQRQSSIAFTLHDSVVIDMSAEDGDLLHEIKSVFEETRWGPFRSNVRIGKDFGNMKEVQV